MLLRRVCYSVERVTVYANRLLIAPIRLDTVLMDMNTRLMARHCVELVTVFSS